MISKSTTGITTLLKLIFSVGVGLTIIFFFSTASTKWMNVSTTEWKKDYYLFFDNRVNIYDENGIRRGYIRQSTDFPDRIDIYDVRGVRRGYLEKGQRGEREIELIRKYLEK